jgi:prophage regulatory protein
MKLPFHFLRIMRMPTNQNASTQTERLLRLPEVESIVGLKKSSIYEGVKKLTFPAPVRLSRRAVCWSSSAINAWVHERINAGGR